jgi:hypothetical protein
MRGVQNPKSTLKITDILMVQQGSGGVFVQPSRALVFMVIASDRQHIPHPENLAVVLSCLTESGNS